MPALYSAVLVLSLAAVFLYKLRVDGIFACPSTGYAPDAYLSDCTARTYGDYDHGAFWFGLEPSAQRAASGADVLLIGNSRLQFALSGPSAAAWFTGSRTSYYLLGFSNSETVAFFSPLIEKLQPRAKAYVINFDRIFDDRISPPTEQLLQVRDIQQRYKEKQTWQQIHSNLCGAVPLACGQALAVYRTRETGAWHRIGAARLEPKETTVGAPSEVARWSHYADLGEAFLAKLAVDRRCVIATLVPTVNSKVEEARAIAARLGLDLIAPNVDGMRTFDGSHLDQASAERWSAQFLAEAGPRIRECVGDKSGAIR